MKKRFLALLCALSIILTFTFIPAPDTRADSAEEAYWRSMSSDYYRSRMTTNEQKLYDRLDEVCMNALLSSSDITVDDLKVRCDDLLGTNIKDSVRVFQAFVLSNPQYYFIRLAYSYYSMQTSSGRIVGLYINPQLDDAFKTGTTRASYNSQLKTVINDWNAQIQVADPSVYPEKVEKAAHDLLIANIEYEDGAPFNQYPISALLNHQTVCFGFARSMEMFMNMNGIECTVVGGSGHAWNMIKLHGYWYVVDVTFDNNNDLIFSKPYFDFYNTTYSYGNSIYPDSYNVMNELIGLYPETNNDNLTLEWGYYSPYIQVDGIEYFIVNEQGNRTCTPVTSGSTPPSITYNNKTYTVLGYIAPTVPPTATPEPTATLTPKPTVTKKPTVTPRPTVTVTPKPTVTKRPTVTPRPTVTVTPKPTVTKRPTVTPRPTVTVTSKPTATDVPTSTPKPTATTKPRPTATSTPVPTVTAKPTATSAPVATATTKPTVTSKPATSTPKPAATSTPKLTATPKPTATSKPTATTRPIEIIDLTDMATPTPLSIATATPVPVTRAPSATPVPEKDDKLIRDFVDRIYLYVLDRDPEKGGEDFWAEQLYNFNTTGADTARSFIFSDEFIGRKTSDKEFITILYKTFFGRDPEADGIKFWTDALKNGSLDRVAVAANFIESQEWADTCAAYGIRSGGNTKPNTRIEPTDLTRAFVERMYTTAMERPSDPEGLKFWSVALANFELTGEQVGTMFFLSDEMKGFGISNSEFVARLYKTFMDREPEKGGFDFWVGYLNDGGSREGAVLGFTRSEEFIGKCIGARILPY